MVTPVCTMFANPPDDLPVDDDVIFNALPDVNASAVTSITLPVVNESAVN